MTTFMDKEKETLKELEEIVRKNSVVMAQIKTRHKMKTYIAYSSSAGPTEGTILVIANTARKAKNLAWKSGELFNVDEWTDLAVRWLRDEYIMRLADQVKLAAGEPHVVAEPLACESCKAWGCEVDDNGICCGCGQWAGLALGEVMK